MSNSRRRLGFTLVEIMIVILIIGILMSIAVPTFMRVRDTSRRNVCIANLKYIDSRKEQFAMEAKLDNGATVQMTDIFPVYLKNEPKCPGSGSYTINVVGVNPTCSLSASGHEIP